MLVGGAKKNHRLQRAVVPMFVWMVVLAVVSVGVPIVVPTEGALPVVVSMVVPIVVPMGAARRLHTIFGLQGGQIWCATTCLQRGASENSISRGGKSVFFFGGGGEMHLSFVGTPPREEAALKLFRGGRPTRLPSSYGVPLRLVAPAARQGGW